MSLPAIKALAIAVLGLSYLISDNSVMAYPTFTCAYEKKPNPPLAPQAVGTIGDCCCGFI
jgi:hypothetical protein